MSNRFYKPDLFEGIALIRAACEAAEVSMVEASFRWLLNHSSLSDGDGVVLGASSSEQLAQNLAGCATAEALPPAVVSAFDEAWKIGQEDAFAFWRGYSKDQPGWEDMDPGAACVLSLCGAQVVVVLTPRAAVVQVRREEVNEAAGRRWGSGVCGLLGAQPGAMII